MTTRIVVPLDESTFSESALPVGDAVATALDGEVHLLAAGWGTNTDVLTAYLSDRQRSVVAPSSIGVAPDTFPATAIAESLTESPDGLVVMATHGRSGLGRALLGSVAETVLQRTDHPVILIGPDAAPDRAIDSGVLALATDGSPLSAMVLPRAATLAKALGASVIVLGVVAGGGTPLGGADRGTLDNAMSSAVTFLSAEGVDASSAVLMGASADEAIVDWLREDPAGEAVGLVAITSHGRGGLARTALGSTAMKIVHHSPCATLVQRPAR